jgi:predicted dehydrogenase
MNIAIVGCGFVADYYAQTLKNYPDLKVAGVFDIDKERLERFCTYYQFRSYTSLEELLAEDSTKIVLNLTNPKNHYEVSLACLRQGKHVYTEKPISMDIDQAKELVTYAAAHNLVVSSAPCSLLSETAQTLWKGLRDGLVGRVNLVYAELDDGLVHKMRYKKWISESGAPWPYKDEFEVGCTLEHAGYYITWLVAFFGPAKQVTSFASCLIPDKETDVPLDIESPDFSVACIEFESGITARLTCSIIAPHDHALKIFGNEGILFTNECWKYTSPVYLKKLTKLALWAEKYPAVTKFLGLGPKKLSLVTHEKSRNKYRGTTDMDFARGVVNMANSIKNSIEPVISAEFSLHVNEIVLAIQNSQPSTQTYQMTTTCKPVPPMD